MLRNNLNKINNCCIKFVKNISTNLAKSMQQSTKFSWSCIKSMQQSKLFSHFDEKVLAKYHWVDILTDENSFSNRNFQQTTNRNSPKFLSNVVKISNLLQQFVLIFWLKIPAPTGIFYEKWSAFHRFSPKLIRFWLFLCRGPV